MMHIFGAKFQKHCLNSFRVIVYLVLQKHYKNVNTSETKKDVRTEKRNFSVF